MIREKRSGIGRYGRSAARKMRRGKSGKNAWEPVSR